MGTRKTANTCRQCWQPIVKNISLARSLCVLVYSNTYIDVNHKNVSWYSKISIEFLLFVCQYIRERVFNASRLIAQGVFYKRPADMEGGRWKLDWLRTAGIIQLLVSLTELRQSWPYVFDTNWTLLIVNNYFWFHFNEDTSFMLLYHTHTDVCVCVINPHRNMNHANQINRKSKCDIVNPFPEVYVTCDSVCDRIKCILGFDMEVSHISLPPSHTHHPSPIRCF